ncbi:MAG: MG2 domain-containing protein, partial [Bacteroidota bacterium]
EGNQYLRNVARPVARKTIQLQQYSHQNPGKFSAYAVDLKELIAPEPGAIYHVEFNFKPAYSSYRCAATNFSDALSATENFDEEEELSYWDNPDVYYNTYYYDADYDWYERDNPCHSSYYRNRKVSVNVLASNLGVTVKKGVRETYWVSVNDIISTQPLAGAKITFYNFQQQSLGTVLTDVNGMANFRSERPAYFAIAERENQKTYVKLNDGNALSVSTFDVSGTTLKKGLKGYLYGERGVWRPGDTIFLSFLLHDKARELPANHPVKLELSDPYGKITHREIKTSGLNKLYTFAVATHENAPTGNWNAKVSVGGANFSKRIKIETVKPNRLKIKTDFDADILSGSNPVNGTMDVTWLHGAVAKNLKADINARFAPQTTAFNNYPGYVFDDPSRKFSQEEQLVFEGTVNDIGKATFSITPQLSEKAPGMLKASFLTKVYENGGDFSTDVFTKIYSPYPTYIGLNVPKGDKTRGMLLTDTKHRFEVVSVDENGNAKPVKNLKVTIHKVRWRWWWDTSYDNLSSYTGSQYSENVFATTLSTGANGKATFDFELKYPDWGRYLVRIEDPEGGHATGKTIYIDWPGWAGKSRKNDPSAATMLVFSTDKKKYDVGEKAIVTFPSSKAGRALVTVENGSDVLESMWIMPQQGETKFELPISSRFTPNVFIHISLLQPHASTANDLPIRLYGLMPILVEDPETKLTPQIKMPDVLRPEETITVKVSEQDKKAMTYSIAVVDEGLLDLTRFKTPNPWNTFYAREALGVKTWDVYDDVIGAYGGRIDQVFAIGGGEELAGAKNKKANRFKPMVVYLGPFSLKQGKTNSHQIDIPKYVGSVRTMVVAGNPDTEAYGSAEKTTPVRKPLMVLASLPRKITPGEKVSLPVTVFAMENKVKNVTVTLKKDKAYRIIGNVSQNLSFSQPDEKMLYFDLEVTDATGIGKVVVEASGNGEKAAYEVEIDVVNPNPVTTSVQDVVLEPGGKQTINLETFGVSGSNTARIEFSSLPPMDFNGRMQYLIRYPHGCLEQLTSAAFPQLYLSTVFDLTLDRKSNIQQNIKDAINRLASYQLPNGGFSYWPGQQYANDWGSSYAGHFLLEAEKEGYVLPIGFKSNWITYQQQAAKQWRKERYNSDLTQAYRLYTLALAGSADISSMNRLRETPGISNTSKHRLAAAYALIGRKNAAQQLFNSATVNVQSITYDHYTYGSTERNRAMALETLMLLNDKTQAQELAKTIAKTLSENRWMSTQSTAYSLLAMAKFAEFIGGKAVAVAYTTNGKQDNIDTEKVLVSRTLPIKAGSNTVTLKNNKDNTLFVRVLTSGILPVGEEKTIQRNLKATVVFKGKNGKTIPISQVQQGTAVIAELTVINQKGESVKDIALTGIFPGGWEIVNTRFTDFGSFAQNKANYTDIRDDRINFYFDLKKYERKTFRVLLNASYPGTYYLPGIQCEAMYDNDFIVRTKGQWVNVIRN